MLGTSETDLTTIACDTAAYWKRGKRFKKASGEYRITSDAKGPLKAIHEQINQKFLKQVYYPHYILAGIRDPLNPRDYVAHAQCHTGKTLLICEDIAGFFPSTTEEVIHSIWRHFFPFHADVAEILTKLTTYDGCLPQGWKCSSYLANLVFWRTEASLVDQLAARGFAYSRFMDDIAVSKRGRYSRQDKHFAVSSIYRLLFQQGYRPKRPKHFIGDQSTRMELTGLIVNGSQPSLPKEKRNLLRSLVHKIESFPVERRNSEEFTSLWSHTSGKIGELAKFDRRTAKQLRDRINLAR